MRINVEKSKKLVQCVRPPRANAGGQWRCVWRGRAPRVECSFFKNNYNLGPECLINYFNYFWRVHGAFRILIGHGTLSQRFLGMQICVNSRWDDDQCGTCNCVDILRVRQWIPITCLLRWVEIICNHSMKLFNETCILLLSVLNDVGYLKRKEIDLFLISK